jgi:hypothetical protein
MKTLKQISILFLFVISIFITNKSYSQLPPADPAFKLVYADEFSGDTISIYNWRRTYPWHQSSNYANFNLAAPVPMAAIKIENTSNLNCYADSGTLKLVSRKVENLNNVWNWPYCSSDSCHNGGGHDLSCVLPPNYSETSNCWDRDPFPFHFTSGMLFSNHSFRYGYFEIRFRIPNNFAYKENYKGHGAGFWLYSGGDGINSDWSEIDFPEINAYCPTCTTIQHYGMSNTHYREIDDSVKSDPSPYYNFEPNTWYKTAIYWTSNSIEFYINDELFFVSDNHASELVAMHPIINLGGQYQPLDNFRVPYDTVSPIATQFPFTFEIDYFRVYQHKHDLDCSTDTTLNSFSLSNYGNKLYNTITMGTNINIANVAYQSFWASDYVLLNEGTFIDANSTVLINTNECDDIVFTKTRNDEPIQPPKSFLDKLNK